MIISGIFSKIFKGKHFAFSQWSILLYSTVTVEFHNIAEFLNFNNSSIMKL